MLSLIYKSQIMKIIKNFSAFFLVSCFTLSIALQSASAQSTVMTSSATSALTCTSINQNLYRGANGNEVKKLQKFLFEKGYLSTMPKANKFGPATVAAVKKFQSENNLIVTGNIGKVSRDKIKELSCGDTSSKGSGTKKPLYEDEIKVLKEFENSLRELDDSIKALNKTVDDTDKKDKEINQKVKGIKDATKDEIITNKNAQKLGYTEYIIKKLQEHVSTGGVLPTNITETPKEICDEYTSKCVNTINLSNVSSLRGNMPIERDPNGKIIICCNLSRVGNMFTVSNRYPEGGKIVQTTREIKPLSVNDAVEVELIVTPSIIKSGEEVSITHSAKNATVCELSPSSKKWTGVSLHRENIKDLLNKDETYTLTCKGPGGSATKTAKVTVTQ